jgi:hypothetical protein
MLELLRLNEHVAEIEEKNDANDKKYCSHDQMWSKRSMLLKKKAKNAIPRAIIVSIKSNSINVKLHDFILPGGKKRAIRMCDLNGVF